MPSVSSSLSRESITWDTPGERRPSNSGSIIIAVQPTRFLRALDCTVKLYRRAIALLLPLTALSTYSLGVALILCVTVIWVASSEWIQHIFGALDYNKPFFLTYFNTTGFCLWNAGFLLSPRWRRTPWDEASKAQPVCIEDARLEVAPRVEGEGECLRETEAAQPVGSGDAQRAGRRMVLPLRSSENRAAAADPTLSCAVAKRNVQLDGRQPLPPGDHFGVWSPMRCRSIAPALQLHGVNLARSVGAHSASALAPLPQPSMPHGSLITSEMSASGVGSVGSLLGDNDDVDIRVELSSASGSIPATPRRMEDECRDYSLPTSSASSAREEVVSVMLTDEDDGYVANPAAAGIGRRGGGEGGGLAPNTAAQLWEATRRSTVVSSELLQHDSLGVPHRRRFHQRARRQRILRYSLRRIWTCALFFCPLWFLANYLFNLSLSITSVASNTILSSTSTIWTLLFSYVMLRQRVGIHRIVAVALCVGGTIMVGLADKNASGGHNTVGGDIVALLSAFFYAAYTSVLKWHLPDDERFAMGMVFGAVGVLNLFFLWPGLVLLNISGVEPFSWPTRHQFWPLLLNALIGTNLSDVLWARSVVLTSPVVATLGLSLTTPLAMVVDAIFKEAHFTGLYSAGAVLVMTGFLLANLPIQINVGV
ncbi:hypothetical protein ABL78_2222 [Leptomonas seymouri]|uniref:EamA domain-containing protein n=1 Tax=Leptomonas seymouri TaxID=5684 RepID=A0A0N1IM12_LEPSE|nr:hypothetical protein ABL78_2222 [Leptomonas seymouri]|eukprot:KPI88684.1 hypothetical protein ABL78_2222 [Leptomonas seymouri]